MTFSHDQIRDHLLDFLAGELTGEARAAFDAHLSGCEACRGEVRGFERARSVAREVIRAPLAEAVPSGIRARVLAAAARQPAKAIPAAGKPAAQPQPGWLARWFDRRGARWTFPTFATVAAMAAFLLVRETVFREAKQPLPASRQEERATPPVTTPPAPTPAPPVAIGGPGDADASGTRRASGGKPKAAKPRAVAQSEQAGRLDVADGRAEEKSAVARDRKVDRGGDLEPAKERPEGSGAGSAGATRNGAASLQAGAKPAAKAAAKTAESPAPRGPAKGNVDDLLGGSLNGSARRERAVDKDDGRGARQKRSASGFAVEAELDRAPAPKAAPPAATPSIKSPSSSARPPGDGAFAAPPPPAPAARRPPSVTNSSASADEAPAPIPSSDQAASPSAERADQVATSSKKSRARMAPAGGAADAPAPSAAVAKEEPADPVPPLVDRAEKLMVARRFSDAAVAYRDLLRRFPGHPSVPAWRKRLATAEAATAAGGFASPPPAR